MGGMQVPPHVAEGDVARAGGQRCVAQRSVAVGRDDHVEPPGERRQQAGDVRLRPSGLGERDEQQDPRSADHLTVQLYSGPMSVGQPAACRAAGVLAIVLFAWWATADGGYAPGAWYPGALLVLAALAGCVRPGSYRALSTPARWALAAFAGFTVWSFCSIAWADARGDAWDGANRTLLYLTVFALFAAVAWTAGEAAVGLGAFALVTAGVGAWEIARALAGDAQAVFFDGRLAAPIGYENASAALFLAAFWAALLIAARRQTPGIARGVLLAAAGLLLQLTILAQSRGSLIAGAVTLAVAVALVHDRAPLLLALSAVALAAAASLPALLSVYDGGAPGGEPDLVPVVVAMCLSAAALFATGLGLEAATRWVGAHARASRTRVVAAAAALVAATAGGLALAGGPAADSRFAAGPGSGRYDFWRVAALEFARNPVGGVGADNFAHDYVRDRDGREEPLYPHSLVLRAVAQTGVVGGALLALFLGAVVMSVRSAGDDVAVAALVVGAVWVSHGVDRLAVGDPGRRSAGDGRPGSGRRDGSRGAPPARPARRSRSRHWPARRRCPMRCRRCRRGRSTAPCAAGATTRPRRCAASSAHERSTPCPTSPTSSPACWPAAPATTSGHGRRSCRRWSATRAAGTCTSSSRCSTCGTAVAPPPFSAWSAPARSTPASP